MIIRRIQNVWRAMIGSGLSELETHNAEAMLELEREQLHKQVAQYNRGLAGHAGMCARLGAQLERLDREQGDLETRVHGQLELGQRDKAARYALRLEAIASQQQELRAQLEQGEATYQELVRARDVAIDAAREKIEGLKRAIGDYRVHTALADLSEMASSMHGQIGVGDGTMERIRERLEERRDYAVGRARVARDAIDMRAVEAQEAEQAALADHALARYEARRDAAPGSAPAGSDA